MSTNHINTSSGATIHHQSLQNHHGLLSYLLAVLAILIGTGLFTAYHHHNDGSKSTSDSATSALLHVRLKHRAEPIPTSRLMTLSNIGSQTQSALAENVPDSFKVKHTEYTAEELIDQLSAIQYRDHSELSAEDINNIQQILEQLSQQGEDGLAAIKRYIKSNDNVDFHAFNMGDKLAYSTLRLALFDVLHQIGGKKAESIWFNSLKGNNDPVEISMLSRYLEDYAPGHYKQYILNTVRKALSLALADSIDGKDAGPLFQILQDYGDESVLADLEQSPQLWWGEYASVVLAKLPDGIGISSLARMVKNASPLDMGARFALQMLAQSAQYPEAQAALIESIGNNQMPAELWPEFAQLISGTYQIQMENPKGAGQQPSLAPISSVGQMISFTPGGGQMLYGLHYITPNLTPVQIEERIQLVVDLLDITSNPAAVAALEESYGMLLSISKTKNE
jgi:hypothetical protein